MRQFRRTFLFAALSAMPLAILSIMQAEFTDSRELRRLVDQSLETRANLTDLLSTHLNTETGPRGYLLTAGASFLGPYSAGKAADRSVIPLLGDHLADEPELAGGILRLRRLTDRST